jgi:signal transduction histidine kinase
MSTSVEPRGDPHVASSEMRTLLLDMHDALLERRRYGPTAPWCATPAGRPAPGGGAHPGAEGLPATYQEALYRLAPEDLDNAVSHARASRATVMLDRGRTVRLQVEDDGVRFGVPTPAFAYGLAGMRECVVALGGRLQLDNGPSGGDHVVAKLPLPD